MELPRCKSKPFLSPDVTPAPEAPHQIRFSPVPPDLDEVRLGIQDAGAGDAQDSRTNHLAPPQPLRLRSSSFMRRILGRSGLRLRFLLLAPMRSICHVHGRHSGYGRRASAHSQYPTTVPAPRHTAASVIDDAHDALVIACINRPRMACGRWSAQLSSISTARRNHSYRVKVEGRKDRNVISHPILSTCCAMVEGTPIPPRGQKRLFCRKRCCFRRHQVPQADDHPPAQPLFHSTRVPS